jgi:hypothetical protein
MSDEVKMAEPKDEIEAFTPVAYVRWLHGALLAAGEVPQGERLELSLSREARDKLVTGLGELLADSALFAGLRDGYAPH